MFWRPLFLAGSDWLEHIPFAFWLIEAHKPSTVVEVGTNEGASYFAICQAVERLRLDTRCYAISDWNQDTALEDDNSDEYRTILNYNQTYYSAFSRLVRSTNEQALENFTNGCIDLLHVDGAQSYSEVKRILEVWLPKLSDRAVVMIHDTNVREGGLQLHRLFEENSQQYPHFEFRHGQGLGILGIGSEQTDLMHNFFEAASHNGSTQMIQDVFSRLGRACEDAYAAKAGKQSISELSDKVFTQKEQMESIINELVLSKESLDTNKEAYIKLDNAQQLQTETHALERGQLVERSSMLQKRQEELRSDLSNFHQQLNETHSQLNEKNDELLRLSLQSSHQGSDLKKQLEETKATLSVRNNEAQQLTDKNHELAKALEENDKIRMAQSKAIQALEEENLEIGRSSSTKIDHYENEQESMKTQLEKNQNKLRESESAGVTLRKKFKQQIEENTQVQSTQNERIESLERALDVEEKNFVSTTHDLNDEISKQKQSLTAKSNEGEEISKQLLYLKEQARLSEEKLNASERDQLYLTKKLKESELRLKSSKLVNAKHAEDIKYLQEAQEISQQRDDPPSSHGNRPVASGQQQKKSFGAIDREKVTDANTSFETEHMLPASQNRKKEGKIGYWQSRKHISIIDASGLFDEKWYLHSNPDVANDSKARKKPLRHFLLHGGLEGRDPSKDFNANWYLKQNADVAEAGINPLLHYILYGKSEGRLPKPSSDQQ